MLTQQKIFFDLLRFCIGAETGIPASVKDVDWKVQYDIAKKQALLGVLFDGLERLPSGLGIDKDLLLHWMAECQMIERANKRLNAAAVQISRWFQTKGFRTCILKGQGNALMYPNSLRRTPGDIDVWVDGSDKKVISFVRSISPKERASYHHIDFPPYKGVEIDVHYRPCYLQNLLYNYRLQRFFRKSSEEQFVHKVCIGEAEVAIPVVRFNVVYQLAHIYTHLFQEGVGLRQIVDYYFVVEAWHTDLADRTDEVAIQNELKHLGLWSFCGAVMYVLHEVLGLPEGRMIVPMDEKRGRLLLDEILSGGNFGYYDERFSFGRGVIGHNIQRLYRDLRLVRYYPAEALSEPIFRI